MAKLVRFTRIVTETVKLEVPDDFDWHEPDGYGWLVDLAAAEPEQNWRVDDEEHIVTWEEED